MSRPSPPTIVFAAQSSAGRVRTHNEDALACRPELGLWAVADGMGGHASGEVASARALDGLIAAVAQGQTLEAAVQAAHQAVLAAAASSDGAADMGSTLVAVRMQGDAFELAWIGDSRAYRIAADRIEQLSHDHSWVQVMMGQGITPQSYHPVAAKLRPQELEHLLTTLRDQVSRTVSALPDHGAYVARYCGAQDVAAA